MNKLLKWLLIAINLGVAYIAYTWYTPENKHEPIIVICLQLTTVLSLFFEKSVSKILTKGIRNNSDVDVDVEGGSEVTTEDIDNSKINIRVNK